MNTGLLAAVVSLLLAGLALIGLLAFGLLRSVLGLASSSGGLEPADLPEDAGKLGFVSDLNAWSEDHGFEWVGVYAARFPSNPPAIIVAWQRADGTYLVGYDMASARATELVTVFDEDRCHGLTTSNTADSNVFPKPPGRWGQSFHGASPDDLLGRHEAALAHLAAGTPLRPARPGAPFEELVTREVRRDAAYVRSHLFWPLRGVLWYALRKRKDGVPVERQPLDLDRVMAPAAHSR